MSDFNFHINEDTVDFKLFEVLTAAGWNGQEANITVTNTKKISASNPSLTAFDASGIPASCTLTIINQGMIVGAGGDGGNATCNPTIINSDTKHFYGKPGKDGGNAIQLSCPTNIDNSSGYIFAGGGGGAGGFGYLYIHRASSYDYYPANAGSGGAGSSPGAGGKVVELPASFNGYIPIGIVGNQGNLNMGGAAVISSRSQANGGAGGGPGENGSDSFFDDRCLGEKPIGGKAGLSIFGKKFIANIIGSDPERTKGAIA